MSPRHPLRIGLLLAGATVSAGGVGAAESALSDPMRPPAGLGLAAETAVPGSNDSLVLQSVLTGSPGAAGRSAAAVISGQVVALGGRIGEMQLTRITETSVLLQGPQGSVSLAMNPAAQKLMRGSAASQPASSAPLKLRVATRKEPQGVEKKQ